MAFRRDTLIPASMIIQDAERIAKGVSDTTVATVGKMEITPNMINVVPGEVKMCFDIRDIYMVNVEKAADLISQRFYEICRERKVEGEIHESIRSVGTLLPRRLTDVVEEAVRQTGAPYRRMMSGAAHDAQMMARITDTAMIFVPSIGGISHDPREKTDYADIALGAQALCNALLSQIGA
jgi:hydantoinase/carbamoylase family amidase